MKQPCRFGSAFSAWSRWKSWIYSHFLICFLGCSHIIYLWKTSFNELYMTVWRIFETILLEKEESFMDAWIFLFNYWRSIRKYIKEIYRKPRLECGSYARLKTSHLSHMFLVYEIIFCTRHVFITSAQELNISFIEFLTPLKDYWLKQ